MANRYDIIRIDFQASAKGANTAIESIRKEAEDCNNRITELKKNIAEAPKNGTDAKILQGWNDELKMTEKRFKQFNTAYRELIKGMRALDEGVKMFNDGSLATMNAAFQKTVNNAAKLAQSKLTVGTDEWRQMGALMQETEQNYTRMQRDTDQLIESLQNGGTVFLKTIEDEKKGLQDLLQVLPYMGTEYRKASDQLDFLVKKTDEMAIKERQMKGEIATTDDARRVSIQLTEKGAEAARQRAAAADQEIEKGKQEIELLEKEREEREKNARLSAQAAAEYRENQRMHEDEIERLDKEIRREDNLANSKKNGLDALRKKALQMKDDAETEKKTQQELDGAYETAKEKVAKLREEVERLRQGATSTPTKDGVAEAMRTGAEEAASAVKRETEATRENTGAKKEEVKAGKEAAETNKKEAETAETLKQKHEGLVKETGNLIEERNRLTKERDGLVKTLEAEAAAAERAANAFASLSKEEAEAMLKERQAVITKGEDGKFSYTNAENAQHFLIESMRQIKPGNAKGDALSLDSAGVAKIKNLFKERYGIADDADVLPAIRGLLSGENGSLIKMGMMSNGFSRVDLDMPKVTAYSKIIKDLTEVINGEVKAIEGESEAKMKLEQVNTRLIEIDEKIDANEKESREIFRQRRAMMSSAASTTDELTEKTNELSEAKKKDAAATNEQIEAIKKMSVEEAVAASRSMKKVSTVGFKDNKLDMSNPEEVQSWLITQMIKRGASVSRDGTLSVGGQNIDGILSSFKERYQLKGDNQKVKQLFKDVVQGKGGGGLLREGGVVDFSADTLMVKANAEAYQGRIDKLKALFEITNKASYAAAHSTETTRKDTQAVTNATEAIKELTAAEQQALEVQRLKKAYDTSKDEYEKMKGHLAGLKSKKKSLPVGIDGELERKSLEDEINDYDKNVKSSKGTEVRRLKGQWQRAAEKLAQMQNEETTAENQNTEATERNAKSKGNKVKASEAAAKATGEEMQKSAELIAKEKELKDAEAAEATALKNKEDQQKKTNDVVQKAADAETKADEAEKKHAETMKNLNDERQSHVDGLKQLNEANKNTIATNEQNQKLLADTNGKIQEQGEKIRDAERIKAQAKTDGIEKTEQAIRLLTEENRRIDQNSFTWKRNTIEIQHLQEALDEMKGKPALMMMEQRMKNVGALSASAVTETKKFWEAMVQGAEKGSERMKEAEAHLKTITEEERKRSIASDRQQARPLFGDLSKKNTEEIRAAIEAGKRLIDTYDSGSPAAQRLAQAILNAEEHMKNYGIEAERAARREAQAVADAAQRRKEADAMMRQQLDQGASLSESALKAQQQYWQRLIDDPKTAKESLAGYRYELERTNELIEQQANTNTQRLAGRLNHPNQFANMSEGELRVSIEAGKKLVQTYKSGSVEAETLAKNILAAENHIKNYGLDAQRAAQREAQAVAEAAQKRKDADTAMRKQLYNQQNLSESALKAQEQYWRRLIDDPNTASQSLKRYEKDLEHVHQLQEQMAAEAVRTRGETAFEWFRTSSYKDASANKLKEMIADMRAYRDSLPSKSEAAKIEQIDYFLREAGTAAEIAAAKTMTMKEALRMGLDARSGNFKGTVEQLTLAKKTLEELQQKAVKGGLAWRRLQEGIDSINLELQRTGHLSGEVMDILNKPKGKSFNELKQAIEQGRKALASMRTETEEDRKAFNELSKKVKDADFQMRQLGNSSKGTANAFEKAWSRFKTYVAFYVSAAAAIQKVVATFGDLMELSDKMGEVRKTTGFTADEVGRLSESLKKMDVRSSLTELMDVSTKAGQLGMKTEQDVLGFTEAANKLMIALPEMGAEAATEMMKVAMATGEVDKIRKQMQEGTIKGSSEVAVALEKVGSTIDQLRANSAAAAPQITDFVKRLGAVGAQSGISIDQVAAMGSTIDALGLRIEMSATALSRMIPAIKNNAFAVAKAIKVEPSVLRSLFETGRGMEAILMIFQHIRDAGMNEDSIEKMLGMAGMQEVMKELNQMGARAGIVFAGLSQNVDMLREHLEIAGDAYEENMAIEREFQKMNETTAAKWARFKNELEETFVGDRSQRLLGWLIDQLRLLVNVISGNVEPAFKGLNIAVWMAAAYFTELRLGVLRLAKDGLVWLYKSVITLKNAIAGMTWKSFIAGMQRAYGWTKLYISANLTLAFSHDKAAKAAARAELANNGLNKSLKANVILAVVAAVAILAWKLHEWNEKAKEAAREAAKFQAELDKETKKVDKLFESVGKATVKTDEATKKVEEARRALKAAQEQADGSKESTDRLAKAEADLATAEEELKNKQATHARTIQDINSQYGHYLGFMLSEVSNAQQLAAARELINEKLRETITLKRKEAALERIEQSEGESRDKAYADLYDRVYGNAWTTDKKGRHMKDAETGAGVMRDITDMAQRYDKSPEEFRQAVMSLLLNRNKGGKGGVGDITVVANEAEEYYKQLKNIREKNQKIEDQFAAEDRVNRRRVQDKLVRQYNIETARYREIENEYNKAKGDAKKEAASKLLKEMDTINEMVENAEMHFETDEKKGYTAKDNKGNIITEKQRLDQFNKATEAQVNAMKNRREALLKEAGNLYQARKTVNGEMTEAIPDTTNGGWGKNHEATSTDWKAMTAEQLVNRRKQMKEFVNAIQDDTDVTRILKEDSALQKAIQNGMSRDVRTVIEWYNTERLKIQDELHARHLTNTGDWMDPKKQRARKKMLHGETKAFLDELDAYYTERKAKIQEAQSAEGLSEAEAQRQIVENEVEWRQRRMELQKLYGDKSAEVSQEEQDAIASIIAERMDDDDKMVKAQIQKTVEFVRQIEKLNEQGANEAREFWGKMDKGAMQDLLRQANATAKQMEAIRKIIAQERPYDGLVDNLRENLTEMGILFADMEKANTEAIKKGLEKPFADSDIVEERFKRLSFLMEQVEQAYDLGIDELTERMEKEGFGEWAKTIRDNHELQDAMMAQLHQTYDKLQDAIKKESSLIKKHVEIMWADIKPGQQMSLKDSYEAAINAMGLQQDQVSRANQLIGAGQSSERVADKLAIKQIQLRIAMQQHYYNLMELEGRKRIAYLAEEEQRQKRIAEQMKRQTEELRRQGREEEAKQAQQKAEEALTMSKMAALDKEHLETSLNLSKAKEQTEQLKLQQEMVAKTEESQNRLYTQLKGWGDLLASSMREVMEASHAGDAEYYNELAKLELTGRGGPGAGTYVVIDDEGTSDAKAHYEYLDQRQAIERQREIEQQNALAEAWKKVFDDINAKISETITDQLNAALQNAAIYDNTAALRANTEALTVMSEAVSNSVDNGAVAGEPLVAGKAAGEPLVDGKATGDWTPEWQKAPQQPAQQGEWMAPMMPPAVDSSAITAPWAAYAEGSRDATKTITDNNKKAEKSTKASFAAMTAAANMYGIAYQTMANDNLSTAQKVEMMIVQAAGQAMISMLTAQLSADTGATASQAPNWVSKTLSSLGPIAGPAAVGVFTALIGGLMGIALSKVSKSKSQIAQATGASASAGKLTTGMLTYAEGNVNEFSDPKSLTPGRTYDVDAADGRTYRARYMGTNPSTHLTNGPEFHLAGERGREMIIDAGTTRQITMNDNEIWHAIQTLSSGGRMRRTSRRGVRAFADGNVDEFEEMLGGGTAEGETGGMDIAAMTEAMNRQTAVQEALLERLNQPIVAQNIWTGPDGIPNMYNKMQKEAKRHGVKFL